MKVQTIQGVTVDADKVEGPTIIVTAQGETCVEAGMWIVSTPGEWPLVLDENSFNLAFRRPE